MKVIIKNDKYDLFWISVFDLNQKYIGKFRTVMEFKRTFPDAKIIRNYSYDQEH